jgi:D-3-phosphoglycerate dehydrogenase / 2-oxoglutarate reductase
MRNISIIGDRFMLSSVFEEEIRASCKGAALNIITHDLPWPDEAMEHGYAVAGMDGLKEYMGSADDILALAGDAEILVTQLAPLSRSMFAALTKLKFVAVSRGGPVNIDMRAARDHGVTVVNTPGRNASAVADALRRGEYRGDLYRADVTGRELHEMTVGVIGYGEVGRRVVRFLKAFGCRILVSDPYVQLSADDLRDSVVQASFETLLAEADVVTLHARVTTETTGMMNAETLRQMKRDATLVNTARGPLMDYDALYEVMSSGHLRGAMLETFAIEPVPPDWPLLQLPNVL